MRKKFRALWPSLQQIRFDNIFKKVSNIMVLKTCLNVLNMVFSVVGYFSGLFKVSSVGNLIFRSLRFKKKIDRDGIALVDL